MDIELNAVFYTNRAAAQFHLGTVSIPQNTHTHTSLLKLDFALQMCHHN